MGKGLNRVILVGNLGADPEIKRYDKGNKLKFNVATTEYWKDKVTGEKRESTEWHRVVMWGPQADVLSRILHKGDKVWVEGKISTYSIVDDHGAKKYFTEVVARDIQIAHSKRDGPALPPPLPPASEGVFRQHGQADDIPF